MKSQKRSFGSKDAMNLISEDQEAEQIVSERSPDHKARPLSFRLERNKSLQDQISIKEDLT